MCEKVLLKGQNQSHFSFSPSHLFCAYNKKNDVRNVRSLVSGSSTEKMRKQPTSFLLRWHNDIATATMAMQGMGNRKNTHTLVHIASLEIFKKKRKEKKRNIQTYENKSHVVAKKHMKDKLHYACLINNLKYKHNFEHSTFQHLNQNFENFLLVQVF